VKKEDDNNDDQIILGVFRDLHYLNLLLLLLKGRLALWRPARFFIRKDFYEKEKNRQPFSKWYGYK
jgi:hypothetical protein